MSNDAYNNTVFVTLIIEKFNKNHKATGSLLTHIACCPPTLLPPVYVLCPQVAIQGGPLMARGCKPQILGQSNGQLTMSFPSQPRGASHISLRPGLFCGQNWIWRRRQAAPWRVQSVRKRTKGGFWGNSGLLSFFGAPWWLIRHMNTLT